MRLWVHPFFVGRGGLSDLLYRDTTSTMFELTDVTTLESGIASLTHRCVGLS